MKNYRMPNMEGKKDSGFRGIPEESFDIAVAEMNREILREMRENEIREARSIRFASNFTVTPPLRDD